MGSPDVACSNSIALARGSIKSNPASRATQAAMNAKNPCMNCSIAATPHPILLESPMPREVFPCPTIAPRRIHAKLILRIEPGGNKADSPHACLQSASDDRNGGKLPSRKRRMFNDLRKTDGTQRGITPARKILTVTDFGGLDVGIPQAMRRSIDFAANSHGIGAG